MKLSCIILNLSSSTVNVCVGLFFQRYITKLYSFSRRGSRRKSNSAILINFYKLTLLCNLPATTILSSLPFRARSLLGSSVLSVILSAASSDTYTSSSPAHFLSVCGNQPEYGGAFREGFITASITDLR